MSVPATLRRWQLWLILLVVIVGWWLRPRADDSELWQRAVRQRAQRDFAGATDTLRGHLAQWPNHLEGWRVAAQTARRAGQSAQASEWLRIYSEKGGDAEIIARERILQSVQQGEIRQFDGGIDFVESHPGDAEAGLVLEAMIQGYIRTQQIPKALHCLELWKDFAVSPEDQLQRWVWRGECWRLAGNPDRAAESFREALKIDPNHRNATIRLADSIAKRNPQEARALLQPLLKAQPDDALTQIIMAQCARLLGELDEAKRLLDSLIRERPNDLVGLIERAQLAMDLDQPNDAETYLRTAERFAPNIRDVIAARIRLARMRGEIVEASKLEEKLKQQDAEAQQALGELPPA